MLFFISVSLDWLQKSIGGVMVSMLASSAIDRRFETQLGQTKDYKIGICCSVLRQACNIKEK
jgi:hypothetical protein